MTSRLGYGALFMLVIPWSLAIWSNQVDLDLAVYQSLPGGLILITIGLALMFGGSLALWQRGGGLPMNAFPPTALVTDGLYHLLPHPLYLGFVLMAAGLSLAVGSGTGLWVTTPLAALLCLSLVVGYEGPYLSKTFGRKPEPLLGPPPSEAPLTLSRRLGSALSVTGCWLISYYAFKKLGLATDIKIVNFSFEKSWPVLDWLYPIYASPYLLVPLSFWGPKTSHDLRHYYFSAWWAIGLASLIYFAWPTLALQRPVDTSTLTGQLLALDMALDAPPNCAFPSFHIIWAILAAYFALKNQSQPSRQHRLIKWAKPVIIWLWAGLVAISCVATSFHGLIDIVGGAVVAALAIAHPVIWRWLLAQSEKLANSWKCWHWRGGRLRLMNHAFYAGAAGGAGFIQASLLAGVNHFPTFLLAGFLALIGAALWGQWLEGSAKLRRPFGYFGSLMGFGLALIIISGLKGDLWLTAAASLAAAPLIQAIGRLRCLVQGCCHGRPVTGRAGGLRVVNPHSRVSGVSSLSGKLLYPTQLYSVGANLVIWIILGRCWLLSFPLSFIGGLYLILGGAARFMEEGWRGEAQTKTIWGLPVYQWLSIAIIVIGFVVSAQNSPLAPPINPSGLGLILVGGVVSALMSGLAMGFDFPSSNYRFSRLSD